MTQWLRRVAALEPARLRAVWAAVLAVAVSLGLTISSDVDRAVQALIVAFAALVPLLQGELTRAKVTPVAKIDAEVQRLAEQAADREWLAGRDPNGGDDFIDLGGQ